MFVRAEYFDPANSRAQILRTGRCKYSKSPSTRTPSSIRQHCPENEQRHPPLEHNSQTITRPNWLLGKYHLINARRLLRPSTISPLPPLRRPNPRLSDLLRNGPIGQSSSDNDTWTTTALAAAQQADIIIYCGGTDNSIAAEELDRYNITWPCAQLSLLNHLSSLGNQW